MADAVDRFLKACTEGSLYTATNLSDADFGDIFSSQPLQFDSHCIWCDRATAFRTPQSIGLQNQITVASSSFPSSASHFKSQFFCVRVPTHHYTYYWKKQGHTAIKVGQHPSLEDIAAADIQRYRPVLGKAYFSELHRATGLASHGIGIGAFVYLRRIFERLIDTHREAFETSSGTIEGYQGMRMAERIEALSSVLPPAVVKFRALYSILSKGIHELSEDECREFFPPVRAGIIAILEQDLQNREKAEKEAILEAEMQKIIQTMKTSGN